MHVATLLCEIVVLLVILGCVLKFLSLAVKARCEGPDAGVMIKDGVIHHEELEASGGPSAVLTRNQCGAILLLVLYVCACVATDKADAIGHIWPWALWVVSLIVLMRLLFQIPAFRVLKPSPLLGDIYAPFMLPYLVLAALGVYFGLRYGLPVIDHLNARNSYVDVAAFAKNWTSVQSPPADNGQVLRPNTQAEYFISDGTLDANLAQEVTVPAFCKLGQRSSWLLAPIFGGDILVTGTPTAAPIAWAISPGATDLSLAEWLATDCTDMRGRKFPLCGVAVAWEGSKPSAAPHSCPESVLTDAAAQLMQSHGLGPFGGASATPLLELRNPESMRHGFWVLFLGLGLASILIVAPPLYVLLASVLGKAGGGYANLDGDYAKAGQHHYGTAMQQSQPRT